MPADLGKVGPQYYIAHVTGGTGGQQELVWTNARPLKGVGSRPVAYAFPFFPKVATIALSSLCIYK